MKNALEIKTRIPQNLSERKQRLTDITDLLFHLNMDDLKMYYVIFLSEKPKGLNKSALISSVSAAMAFKDERTFRDWFFSFPVLTQNLLYRLAFDYFVPVKKLEEELGLSLVHQISNYYWDEKWVFHEELGVNFLQIRAEYKNTFAVLPHVLRMILVDWLVPPPEFRLENCVFEGAAGPPWDNSAEIADSLPLLFDALTDFFGSGPHSESPFRCIRGFKKKEADELRASSAFKAFAVPEILPEEVKAQRIKGRPSAGARAGDLIPDSADLTARFILAMKNFSPVRPEDGQNEVKKLVSAFFSEKSQYKGYVNPPDRHSLEFNVLFDHVSKNSDLSLRYEGELPRSRRVFRNIITFCAKDGGTFDADKVARYIFRNAQDFTFYFSDTDRYLKYRARTLTLDGMTFSTYNDEFYIHGFLKYHLLVIPLFKAYCYLFAALGLLEITQTSPALARQTQNEKNHPLSPYDSLKTFRITEFGKWCLGLTEKRPERPKAEYQAIADKELFLVTVQGNSLERTVYLDKIGRRLGGQAERGSSAESGAGRWRVSPDSFIAGCTDTKQIEDRISRFKALIDPSPAPHWLALFEKVVNRAGLFDKPLDDMLIYSLAPYRDIAEELLHDAELRSLVHRAEGGLLLVPEKNRKKFFALLNAHGIAVFGRESPSY
jgi:hypothetical protein